MTKSKAAIDSVLSESQSHLIVAQNGDMRWFDDENRLHREDGPAFIWKAGHGIVAYGHAWCKRGKLHRMDGPAVEIEGKQSEWWVDGRQLTEEEFYRYVDQITGEVLIPPGKKLTHDKK